MSRRKKRDSEGDLPSLESQWRSFAASVRREMGAPASDRIDSLYRTVRSRILDVVPIAGVVELDDGSKVAQLVWTDGDAHADAAVDATEEVEWFAHDDAVVRSGRGTAEEAAEAIVQFLTRARLDTRTRDGSREPGR